MKTVVRRSALGVLTASLALSVTACGGDPKTEEGVEDTVREFVEEFAAGDGSDACDLVTEDYAEQLVDEWNESEFGDEEEDCEEVIEAGAILFEAFGADDLEIAEIKSEVDGDKATATVEYDDDTFGPESYVLVYEDGDWLIDGEGEEEADEDFDEEFDEDFEDVPTEPTEATTTPVAEPSPIGTTGTVGEWEVSVTEVDEDANALLAKPKYYNSAPDGQFVLVTFEATYVGADRTADIQFDLSWTLTTTDQQVHEQADPTTPADHESWPTEARSGGTVMGQAVFDVDPSQLVGALVTVEGYDDEGNEVYVDFTL